MLRILFIILSVQMAFGAGCLEVQGRWVTAGYLAASIAEFRKLAPETHLLSAPWPGSKRILSNRDLIRMAQQHGVGPLEVASEFCILDKGRRVAAGPIGELTDQVVRAHLSV